MKEYIKEYWNYFKTEGKQNINDLKSIKTFYKQIPNLLTIFRIVATIPINIFFFTGNFAASLVTCGIATFTDLIDGAIARKFNAVSKFGADLDAICDKLFIGLVSVPIVIQNPFMLMNIGLEAGITYTNVKAREEGKKVKSELIGKAKTWILFATVVLGYLLPTLNASPNLLTSLLITLPTTGFQTATLIKYLQINHSDKENTKIENKENETSSIIVKANQAKQKDLKKELVKPATVEELKKEREKLLQKDNDKGYQKIKTDLK